MHRSPGLQEVTRVFGTGARQVTALDNIDLQLHPGELVAVMGPSGSGKSTLLNVAGLLLPPTSGRVLIDGADAADLSKSASATMRRRHLGFVFQNFNLVSTLTVGENVTLPLELDGVSARSAGRPPRKRSQRSASRALLTAFPKRFPAAKPNEWLSHAHSSGPAKCFWQMSPRAHSIRVRAIRS